jgi:hypothetical protein
MTIYETVNNIKRHTAFTIRWFGYIGTTLYILAAFSSFFWKKTWLVNLKHGTVRDALVFAFMIGFFMFICKILFNIWDWAHRVKHEE